MRAAAEKATLLLRALANSDRLLLLCHLSQGELSDNLYSHDSERDSNAIEAVIGRLRRKLKADIIETRRGFGYIVAAKLA